MYYRRLYSLDDVIGEDKFLRLPKHIFESFVMDEPRKLALAEAIDCLIKGQRVLIIGKAGVGKTALLAIILREVLARGYGLALLSFSAGEITNEHAAEGLILFYDDISSLPDTTLRALRKAEAFIATLREEELEAVERRLGSRLNEHFKLVRIEAMSKESIKEVLRKLAANEGISVEDEAYDIVAEKAMGLPVYVWQLVRDLKIQGEKTLTKDIAKKVPAGMLDYVDDILWRVLDEKEDRREVLLSLIIMSDLPNHEIHQDLLNCVFAVAKSEIHGRKFEPREALLSDTFDRMTRYLLKSEKFFYRLPHDSWADVLMGKSRGLMSGEISRLRVAFDKEAREKILRKAAEMALEIAEGESKKALEEHLKTLGLSVERSIQIFKEAGGRVIRKLYAFSKRLRKFGRKRFSDISFAIAEAPVMEEVTGMSPEQILKKAEVSKIRRDFEIKYPSPPTLRVRERISRKDAGEGFSWILWVLVGGVWFCTAGLREMLPEPFDWFWWVFGLLAIAFVSWLDNALEAYFIEVTISGDEEKVNRLVREIKAGFGRNPLAGANRWLLRLVESEEGVTKEDILKSWEI